MSDGRVGHMEEIKLTLLFDISGSLQQKNLFLDLKNTFPSYTNTAKTVLDNEEQPPQVREEEMFPLAKETRLMSEYHLTSVK